MGGFLRRETGRLSPEVPVASFARGLREKGSVPLFLPEMPSPVNIAHLYVGNHDCNLGFGVAYGSKSISQQVVVVKRSAQGTMRKKI